MKILIIGNVGSGKTTLGNKLSNYYNVPLFSIDSIVHDHSNNDNKRSKDEQTDIINNINRSNKDYIIEGVLRSNMDFILNLVDRIILLNYDKKVTLRRIKFRYFKQRIGIEKATYKISRDMYNNLIKWNLEFDSLGLIKRCSKYSSKLIIIRSNKELKKYYNFIYENSFNY